MGVTGLWKLIDAAGKPIPVETLENKILAVDVSIWLHQLEKGQRSEGVLPGLFRRIAKLLFFRIKPVFVFDGGVPALKRKTIAERQRRRDKAGKAGERSRLLLLQNLMKQQVLGKALGKTPKPVYIPTPKHLLKDTMFYLPPLPEETLSASTATTTVSSSDSEESDDEFVRKYGDLHSIDVMSKDFLALPPDLRHSILTELNLTRKHASWANLQNMPQEIGDFSHFQLGRLLKRRSIQTGIQQAEKEMGGKTFTLGEVKGMLEDSGVDLSQRIAADDTTRFIYSSNAEPQSWVVKGQEKKLGTIPEEEEKVTDEGLLLAKKLSEEEEEEELLLVASRAVERATQESAEEVWDNDDDVEDWATGGEVERLCRAEGLSQEEILALIRQEQRKKTVNDGAGPSGEPRPGTSKESDPIETPNYDWSNLTQVLQYTRSSPKKAAKTGTVDALIKKVSKRKEDEVSQLVKSIDNFLEERGEIIRPREEANKESDENIMSLKQVTLPELNKSQRETEEKKVDIVEEYKNDPNKYSGTIIVPHKEESEITINDKKINAEPVQRVLFTGLSEVVSNNPSKIDTVAIPTSSLKQNENNVTDKKKENGEGKNGIDKEEIEISSSDEDLVEVGDEGGLQIVVDPVVTKMDPSNDLFADIFAPKGNTKGKVETKVSEVKKDSETRVEEYEPISQDHLIVSTVFEEPLTTERLIEMQENLEKEIDVLAQQQKKGEKLASSMTEQLIMEAQELLQLFGVPWIVAPMEAEAQCAFLEATQQVQGTISDDSDILLFGATNVYKNFFNQNKFVLQFKASDIERCYKLKREDMILLALLTGSDYTGGLSGVGAVTALEILASYPPTEGDSTPQDRLQRFSVAFTNHSLPSSLDRKLRTIKLNPGFPSGEVVKAYLEPTVNEDTDRFSWALPDLEALRDYTRNKFGWDLARTDATLLPIMDKLKQKSTQSTLHGYFDWAFEGIRGQMSQRVGRAVGSLGGEATPEASSSAGGPRKRPVNSRRKGSKILSSTGPNLSESSSGDEKEDSSEPPPTKKSSASVVVPKTSTVRTRKSSGLKESALEARKRAAKILAQSKEEKLDKKSKKK